MSIGEHDLSEDREAVGICSQPAVFRTGNDKFDRQLGGVEPACRREVGPDNPSPAAQAVAARAARSLRMKENPLSRSRIARGELRRTGAELRPAIQLTKEGGRSF